MATIVWTGLVHVPGGRGQAMCRVVATGDGAHSIIEVESMDAVGNRRWVESDGQSVGIMIQAIDGMAMKIKNLEDKS